MWVTRLMKGKKDFWHEEPIAPTHGLESASTHGEVGYVAKATSDSDVHSKSLDSDGEKSGEKKA